MIVLEVSPVINTILHWGLFIYQGHVICVRRSGVNYSPAAVHWGQIELLPSLSVILRLGSSLN